MVDSTWNRLNLMFRDRDLSHEERIQLVLNSGCDVLNLSMGVLTRIDYDRQTVMYSTSKKLQDVKFNLYDSLCQFTVEHGDLIASHDLTDTDWRKFGIIKPLQFGTYIGVPIVINKQVFGTLFFASNKPRRESFTVREEAFLKMMATAIRNIVQKELMPL